MLTSYVHAPKNGSMITRASGERGGGTALADPDSRPEWKTDYRPGHQGCRGNWEGEEGREGAREGT